MSHRPRHADGSARTRRATRSRRRRRLHFAARRWPASLVEHRALRPHRARKDRPAHRSLRRQAIEQAALDPEANAVELATRLQNLADGVTRSPQQRLKCVTAQEMLELRLPQREMLLAPVLPTQGLAMLYSKRGLGKTYMSLSIAYAVASGDGSSAGKRPPAARAVCRWRAARRHAQGPARRRDSRHVANRQAWNAAAHHARPASRRVSRSRHARRAERSLRTRWAMRSS